MYPPEESMHQFSDNPYMNCSQKSLKRVILGVISGTTTARIKGILGV